LVIVGGGKVPAEIWAKFIELAGGETANIVVIPTALGDSAIQASKGVFPEKDLLEKFGVGKLPFYIPPTHKKPILKLLLNLSKLLLECGLLEDANGD
jgi:hypothetical protein